MLQREERKSTSLLSTLMLQRDSVICLLTFSLLAHFFRSSSLTESLAYAIYTSPIMHLICPPHPPAQFCINIVFNFSWDGCNLGGGGQIRCIIGDVQMAYWLEILSKYPMIPLVKDVGQHGKLYLQFDFSLKSWSWQEQYAWQLMVDDKQI